MVSHCLVLYATGKETLDSISLQIKNFSASAGSTCGINQAILSIGTFPVLAALARNQTYEPVLTYALDRKRFYRNLRRNRRYVAAGL